MVNDNAHDKYSKQIEDLLSIEKKIQIFLFNSRH